MKMLAFNHKLPYAACIVKTEKRAGYMNLRNRRFKTLKEARKFMKTKTEKSHRYTHEWQIKKIPGARKLKYFVGSYIEWLNLD